MMEYLGIDEAGKVLYKIKANKEMNTSDKIVKKKFDINIGDNYYEKRDKAMTDKGLFIMR